MLIFLISIYLVNTDKCCTHLHLFERSKASKLPFVGTCEKLKSFLWENM